MRKTRTRLLPVLALGAPVAMAAVALLLGPAPAATGPGSVIGSGY